MGSNPYLLALAKDLRERGEAVELEHRFAPPRRWRFDLALPDKKIALEVEGGIWTLGRHVRGKGYANDLEKYNEATLLGWRVFRVQPKDVLTEGFRLIQLCLTSSSAPASP